MKTKRTPLTIQCQGPDEDIYIIGPSPDNKFLYRVIDDSTHPETWTEMLKRAESFVDAVNSHDAITAALDRCVEALGNVVGCIDATGQLATLYLNEARAALEAAKKAGGRT